MMYYYLNKQYPGYFDADGMLASFMNYSKEDEAYSAVTQLFPHMSEEFRRKEIHTVLGNRELEMNKPIKELKYNSMEQTRQELKIIDAFEASQEQKTFEPLSDEDEREEYEMNMEPIQKQAIMRTASKMASVYEYLNEYRYEIDYHLTPLDSLHILAESTQTYGLNIDHMLQKSVKDTTA